MPQYRPFLLRIDEARNRQYPVTAEFEGQIREGSIPAGLPLLDKDEIRQAQTWLERGLLDSPYAQEFGDRLFRTLFAPPIDAYFREAYERAAAEGGLRVVLATPLPAALETLPWELLYDRTGGLGYLARSNRCPLVRLYSEGALANPAVTESPLRVLVVWASPSDQAPLSAETEAAQIVAALSKGDAPLARLRAARSEVGEAGGWPAALKRLQKRVAVEVLGHATRPLLEERLAAARGRNKPFHVIHFIGHGQAGETGAFLLLEKPGGASDPVSAEDFSQMVVTRSLNLVVLNACETASATHFLRSTAHALLTQGVPVVVGMQVPVLDRAAVDFSRALFTAFAAGEPVESALATARRLITQANRGAAADWSIPAVYMSTAAGLTLDLPAAPFRLPLPLHMGRALLLGFVAFMGIVTTLLAVPNTAAEVRTRVPVIRCLWPYPMEATAEKFNVVMVPFTHLDERGRVVHDGQGAALARQLYGLVKVNFAGLGLAEEIVLRGPAEGCALPGATAEERTAAARALAQKVNANVLIYGTITESGDGARFAPEFDIEYRGFEAAPELVGPYEMGSPVAMDLPVTPEQFQGGRHVLAPRTRALSLITVGLANYSAERYEDARQRFADAVKTPNWLDDDGKEIGYLMLGNTYLLQASKEKNAALLPAAQQAFSDSLKIDSGFARAQVGMATALYSQSLGDLAHRSIYNLQLSLLDEADAAYTAALGMPAPAEANIPAKVDYGLGQIATLRCYIRGG